MVGCADGQGPVLAALAVTSGGWWVSVGKFEAGCWIQPSLPMVTARFWGAQGLYLEVGARVTCYSPGLSYRQVTRELSVRHG